MSLLTEHRAGREQPKRLPGKISGDSEKDHQGENGPRENRGTHHRAALGVTKASEDQ